MVRSNDSQYAAAGMDPPAPSSARPARLALLRMWILTKVRGDSGRGSAGAGCAPDVISVQ